MKVVLLAGGFGTRISEESQFKPKPMVEIGGKPILWHIMKEYSAYGFNEFVICAGYKQHYIKEWFKNYFIYTSDVTFDLTEGNKLILHEQHSEPWKVTVVDTGLHTMTGGRIKRIQKYVGDDLDGNYVMLMNDPSREYGKVYEIDYDRHVYDGKNWVYLNLPMEQIEEIAAASLKDNTAMYFSCDVGKFLNSSKGVLDLANYDFESLLGVEFTMDKKQRVLTHASGSSHA